jgi:feruloyl esterase
MALPDVRVLSAAHADMPAPHCRVKGLIGGKINVSVRLPDDWNGRFVMGGAGGFVAPDDNQALAFNPTLLTQGFATASTDTGHQAPGQDGSWALNDYEAIVNYGHLGMHRAVVAAKAVIADYYNKASEKSFFVGCSNGGRQAMHSAQRYPKDFDAIVAGAPALDFGGVAASFVSITQKMFPDSSDLTAALVTPESRQLLRKAVVDECDALDGLRDGILNDPRACEFDPSTLACGVDQTEGCIPPDQVDAIKTVYDGPADRYGPIFFGFPFGAENVGPNGWGTWLTGGSASGSPNAAYSFGVGIMRYFVHHDSSWDYVDYDWDRYRDEFVPMGAVLNATNPDLSGFRANGGKLLMFHGWSDVALTAHMSIDYYERAVAFDATAEDDVRLFMMPGVLHCFGGAGPSMVDWLDVLETWHDSGDAPAELTATYPNKAGSRKICAWPRQAQFTGGDPESVDSYECR